MFRRFLVTWLVVSILGYGVAVNADVHDEISTDQVHAIGDHTANPADLDDLSSCDHCCHGLIHLLGLNSTETLNLAANCSATPSPYSVSFISLSPPSLFRPPIAT